MKKKQKRTLISLGICLSFLLAIPLYAILQEDTVARGEPVGNCPKDDTELATLIPDSKDCSKFYICLLGMPIECDCPQGLFFDPEREVCD